MKLLKKVVKPSHFYKFIPGSISFTKYKFEKETSCFYYGLDMDSGKSRKFKKADHTIIFAEDLSGALMEQADKVLTMILANKDLFKRAILNGMYGDDEGFASEELEALNEMAYAIDYHEALEKIWKEDKDE
jgi:hypothetical protein